MTSSLYAYRELAQCLFCLCFGVVITANASVFVAEVSLLYSIIRVAKPSFCGDNCRRIYGMNGYGATQKKSNCVCSVTIEGDCKFKRPTKSIVVNRGAVAVIPKSL